MISKYFVDYIYPPTLNHKERRCTRGFVFDNDLVALIKINGIDDFGDRDHYETPGGGIEENETASECFKREIGEELGIVIDEPVYIGTVYYEFHLARTNTIADVFYAHKIDECKDSRTELEKDLFKGIVWHTIDEWIEILSKPSPNVGELIHKRDLYLLNLLKDCLK